MFDSIDVARAAISLAITSNTNDEAQLIAKFKDVGINGFSINIIGNIFNLIHEATKEAVLESKKMGMSQESDVEEVGIVEAIREAIMQISDKATDLKGSGKLSICRNLEYLSVCIFMKIGVLNQKEAVIGLGHRILPLIEPKKKL